jgi:hypothetical protein
LIVNVFAFEVFPEWSEAVHETVVFPSGKVEPDPGLQLTVGLGSTLSVAVAEKLTAAPLPDVASVVMFEGTVSTGSVRSATVTLKDFVGEVLPAESIAVHDTLVVPIGKVDPDALLQLMVGEAVTLSVAETE